MKSIENNNSVKGMLFIVLAIVLGMHLLDIFTFEGWWTLFIIIPSAFMIIKGENVKGAVMGLAIGVLLLMAQQGIIGFGLVWKLIVIGILLAIGISLIFSNRKNS